MRKFPVAILAAVVLAFSMPSFAQGGLPKFEVFGGYEYLHMGSNTNGFFATGQGFNGWNIDAAYRLHRYLGVEGDVGGTYATIGGLSTHVYTYTGGPVIGANVGPIQPFVHVLAGGARLSTGQSGASVSWNGLAVMAGGGVDAKVFPMISVRLIQFDWLYYHFGSQNFFGEATPSTSASNNVRISTGVVVRF